jgi:cytochrome c peroxidase
MGVLPRARRRAAAQACQQSFRGHSPNQNRRSDRSLWGQLVALVGGYHPLLPRIALTAPDIANGPVRNLRQVIEAMGNTQCGGKLTAPEIDSSGAFRGSLTGVSPSLRSASPARRGCRGAADAAVLLLPALQRPPERLFQPRIA